MTEAEFIKVNATQDDSGHWYLVPNELIDAFNKDMEDEELGESGGFGDKWDEYRTGGDLNLTQLWIQTTQP